MDPITAQLLIRTASELVMMAIKAFRAGGQAATAAEIAAILARSDAVAADIIATAQRELDELQAVLALEAAKANEPTLPLGD